MTDRILLRALAGDVTERPPFWFMRQAGRYLPEYRALRQQARSFLDFCFTPDLAAEATLQPIRRFRPDAAILFADILVVPWALGQAVWFEEGRGPRLEPIRNAAAIDRLEAAGAVDRLDPVMETVRRVREELPSDLALIGFAGAPWTVATYMVEGGSGSDFATIKRWAYSDPETFGRLVDAVADATVDYLVAQIDAGADAVQLFDSWAGVLPEPAFRRWVIEPTARIVAAFREQHPDVPVVGFPRAAGTLYGLYAAESGVGALGLDTGVSPSWAHDNLPTGMALQGNLDPQLVVVGGTPMEIAAGEIAACLRGGPFVFNLGHGVVPETPPAHVEALAAFLRDL